MASEGYPKYLNDLAYAGPTSTYLNKLDICLPRPLCSSPSNGLWIIFVHGGDWHEPSLDRTSFRKTQDLLLKSLPARAKIAALVSLDYRLFPFPSHTTNPSNPTDPARNIQHPTHVQDVLTAV